MNHSVKYYITFISLLFSLAKSNAQSHFVISGYVSDIASGERLNGATIMLRNNGQGVTSNDYGFFSLSVPKGKATIIISYIGYQNDTLIFDVRESRSVHVLLHKKNTLTRVEIKGTMPIESRNDISTIHLKRARIEKLPSFLGEKDLLKAIQLLPGVQAGQEGNSGFYVRGGGQDENLILLDGVPVYNVFHLFGFVSVFTPEAIKSVNLIKGGFPARYGGRLSSILDIKMKEGDLKKYKGDVSVGLLSSKLAFEGPIKKDKSSFIVTARRSYWDLLATPIVRAVSSEDGGSRSFGYHFQDFNAKFNDQLNDKNKLFLSLYTGKDKFHINYNEKEGSLEDTYEYKTKAGLQWGNITGALRWNMQISPKLFANTTLSYSQFNYELEDKLKRTAKDREGKRVNRYLYNYHSGIKDWSLRWDADYYPVLNHSIKFGLHATRHRFTPGVSLVKQSESGTEKQGSRVVFSGDYQAYAEDNLTFGDRLQINLGFHGAAYHVDDTTFLSLQPRIRGRYLFPHNWSLKFGFATMQQPLHLLTSSGVGLPTDLWVPATKKVVSESSIQYTLGFAKSLPWNLDLSVEGYYKELHHVIAYKDGANFTNTASNWQTKVDEGQGKVYGLELFLRRKTGRLSGWFGYTLSWNDRQFDQLNEGEWFPYKFDRRHDIKLVMTYTLNDHINLSATWVYSTGNSTTLPVAMYPTAPGAPVHYNFSEALFPVQNDGTVSYISSRNNFRMRAFHRLNVGIDFKKKKKRGIRTWNVSIYNVYSRQNPYFYFYKHQQDGIRSLMQFSLLPVMPSVSYRFQFK